MVETNDETARWVANAKLYLEHLAFLYRTVWSLSLLPGRSDGFSHVIAAERKLSKIVHTI